MSHIKFDYSKVLGKFVAPHEVEYMQPQVTAADELIRKGTGAGSDFLGWLDLPENYDREEFDRILKAAEQIKADSDVLVVIGIGGSYLGAKAAKLEGFTAEWVDAGGGSDGNHIAETGVPVVDGCAPNGGSFHSDKEFLSLNTVEERIRMISRFLTLV